MRNHKYLYKTQKTAAAIKTEYQQIQDAIESFDLKTEEQKLAIKSYADEFRILNMKSGLSPSELWHNLRDRGLGIHIYAATVLCDGETGLLRQAMMTESDASGDTEAELDKAFLDLHDTILC